jgi:hypothetical protein
VLFVQDNSYSISDYAIQLYAVLQQVGPAMEAVVRSACSYHVGVVTTLPESNNPVECRTLGDLSRVDNFGTPCEVDNGIFVTEQDVQGPVTLAEPILCLLTSSTQPDDTEQPMAAMLAALEPERSAAGGCNEGFRRPGVPLLVAVISDVDDSVSPGDPTTWHDQLLTLVDGTDELGMVAVIPPSSPSDGGACGASAPRLHDFVDQFLPTHNASLNICAPEPEAFQVGAESVGAALCPE